MSRRTVKTKVRPARTLDDVLPGMKRRLAKEAGPRVVNQLERYMDQLGAEAQAEVKRRRR